MYRQFTRTQSKGHVLGHAPQELERQISQARFFGDLTEPVFEQAGLGPDMTVLDLGCGAGDSAFLAARFVGPDGSVLGVDLSPEAVGLAEKRAAQIGLPNVRFAVGDIATFEPPAPVDALIGRIILMYLPDPAVALRRLARWVKPGGIVVFHEMDLHTSRAEPECPLYELAHQRLKETFKRIGADARVGLRLGRIFEEAGLPPAQMILGARVERGPDSGAYEQIARITRTLLPLMERTGVAAAAEVEIDTLAERLRAEVLAQNATLVSPAFIGAWTRVEG